MSYLSVYPIISQSLGLSLSHSLYISLPVSAAMRVDAAHTDCSQHNDSPLLTQTHTDTSAHKHTLIPWISLCYTAVNTVSDYRCINYYSSRIASGDPRRPLLSFVTMPMAVPVTMVTCPPNTLAHQSCWHEDKTQGLVWLARAGPQDHLWSNQTHNQIPEAIGFIELLIF